MKIFYFGHSYFYFEGRDYSICLDPFKNVGLNEIEVCSDYVFSSHSHYDHDNFSIVKNAKIVENSESFEIINTFHDNKKGVLRGQNKVLVFLLDGYKIAFMGDYGEDENKTLEQKLKGVDILLIPVGGKYTIDYIKAFNFVKKVKPKLVIPMHYKVENSKIDIDGVDKFLSKIDNYNIYNSPFEYKGESGIAVLKIHKEI